MNEREDAGVHPAVVWGVVVGLTIGALLAALVILPTLVWSTLQGDPTIVDPVTAAKGAFLWFKHGLHGEPSHVSLWRADRDVMPPRTAWTAMTAGMVGGVVVIFGLVVAHKDRWRGRRWTARPSWDPRGKVEPRAWARPRDLLHLQPRRGSSARVGRRGVSRLQRLLFFERRAPAPAGGDSWYGGRLGSAEVRSAPELHLGVIAPTRAGKTSRVVIPAALEHEGPAIVLSNKTDVARATAAARTEVGPVWAYAPFAELGVMEGARCGWSPLAGCESWSFALRMGRWLFDADPHSAAVSDGSGGARFYNREAVSTALPPLLHAAALSDRRMSDVLAWIRGGTDGLDEPRTLLEDRGATMVASAVAGVQALEDRPRSLLLMSAAQLVDAYRFPDLEQPDLPTFRPKDLLDEGGTLYLIAPESEQELLAPLFGGILGAVLRACEERASETGPLERPLRILADEAAHLAPLAKLPTYLAVSGGWGVRWCVVYQSLAQVRHRYGDEADAVLGNLLCKLVLGPVQDAETRRYVDELLDEEVTTSTSRARNGGLGSDVSTTTHERRAAKVSAQRLMQLREGEAVFIHGRDLPAITHLPLWWDRRDLPR
jgi:type IV secretion system protein VirD4